MRYVIAISIAALLVGAAHAQIPGGNTGMPPSPNGTEALCYTYDDNGNLVPAEFCRVFKEIAVSGACDKVEWPFNFTVDASIAQWVEWSITYTDADFWVLKPGVYVVDSVAINIKSNGDIQFKADGWADLVGYPSGDTVPVEITILDCGVMPDASTTWYASSALQGKAVLLDLDESEIGDLFHTDGINKVMWIRITVEACDTACEYMGGGMFFVQLDSQKAWVDPETGSWGPGFP
jgi:hypothetical protein